MSIHIQREMPAPQTRVWEAITQAAQLRRWFGQQAEVDLRVGGKLSFGWDGAEHETIGQIIEVDIGKTFAFRWHTQHTPLTDPLNEENSTLVCLTLADSDYGSTLTLKESGFEKLPESIRQNVLNENQYGWNVELTELVGYLSAG